MKNCTEQLLLLLTMMLLLLVVHVSCQRASSMVAKGIKGFKSRGKFFKIMGPRGNERLAYEKYEEPIDDEEEEEEQKSQQSNYEAEIQEEEAAYVAYLKQKEIAKKNGIDPNKVEVPAEAEIYLEQNKVGTSSKKKNKRLGKKKKRIKRMVMSSDDKTWTNGIIPYVFTKEIKTEGAKLGRIRAQNRFEYWTCIRFVPWTKDTSSKYNLDHDNYLMHYDKNGCWSVMGNTKGNGQKISCCQDDVCVHELGHSMGFQHEQKSPLHDSYIRVNNENVEEGKESEYLEEQPDSVKTFGYYDIGSTMHYNRYMFSKNSGPTMTVFDPNLEYMILNPDPYGFYFFYEVAKIHKCPEMKCSDFKTECKNDGYVAYIRGECRCRCPAGLDPESGCTKIYKGDKKSMSATWPSDAVTMLKPVDGCPNGFTESSIKRRINDGQKVESSHIFVEKDEQSAVYSFCSKQGSTKSRSSTKWERGQYCFLKDKGSCPEGFEEGYAMFDSKTKTKSVKGEVQEDGIWSFCCREDGAWKDPIRLPNKEPFVLLEKGSDCQEVIDMIFVKENILINNKFSGKYNVKGSVPDIPFIMKNYYLSICYYWPINYDCGEIIQMSESDKEVVVTSPNYPSNYNTKQVCQWTIMSPENTKLKLEFDSFEVELREDDSCGDALEVRFYLPGQPGVNYCGESFKPSIITERNYLGLVLNSGTDVTKSGFKARVTLVSKEDMCYTDDGSDYRGKTNITKGFQPCLPWSEVQQCPHHMFEPKDLDDDLRENYCRNPGDGTRPWCYIHKDGCLRNYCDTCGLERCFDRFDDCEQLKMDNSNYCESDSTAHYGCRKFCEYCDHHVSKPVSEVNCKEPNNIIDASPLSKLKKSYKVGETVKFKCDTGFEEQTLTCLSTGSWSGGLFVCGHGMVFSRDEQSLQEGPSPCQPKNENCWSKSHYSCKRCPKGWIPYQKKCYKWFDVLKDKAGADDFCKSMHARVTTSKDADENNFILSTRLKARSFWLGLERNEELDKQVWEEDETLVTWGNWKKGDDSSCAYVDRKGLWNGLRCTSAKFISVICKMTPSERKECMDADPECENKLTEEPGACIEYKDFAWHSCPKSCGICTSDKEIVCDTPKLPENVELISDVKSIKVGEMLEYKCLTGFSLAEGQLRRACLKSGELSGSSPVCHPAGKVATPNNQVELRQRRTDGRSGQSYTGDNDAMRIHKDGKLVRWAFYSIFNGEVALQVWRVKKKTLKSLSLELLGQNVVKSTKDHRKRVIDIPESEQISVKDGDLIGFYLPKDNKAGLTFDKCITEFADGDYGRQFIDKAKKKKISEWTVGEKYEFQKDKMECKVISLTAYVI